MKIMIMHKENIKENIWIASYFQPISRCEQAPGGGFHPHGKIDKIDCGFLEPPHCNKKVNPKRKFSCGSYELLVSNVVYQMNEKVLIQYKFVYLFVKFH